MTKDVTTAPTAPTELKAKAIGKTCLRLEWKDNADNESEYEIYQDGDLIKTISSGCHCLAIGGLKPGSTYSFMVKAVNKIGASSSNTISVDTVTDEEVAPVNTAPTATPQSVTMDEDSSKAITLLGEDAEGDALTYTVVTPPSHGIFDGTTYTPDTNYHGDDSFRFTANDGELTSAPATVSIIIKDVPEEKVTVAQALLGPLSGASFKISHIDSGVVIEEGTTTVGDGTDVATAGLIQVTQQTKDSLQTGMYLVEVTGGTDIDANDDRVWDEAPTSNQGTLHAVMSSAALKAGSFKVNILTEIIYQDIKDTLAEHTPAQIEEQIVHRAEKLLKDADGGGDVDGDGDIDNNDVIAWNPADDKPKLRVDYDEEIQPIVDTTYVGEDSITDIGVIFNTAPTATAQSVTLDEDTSKAITLEGTDPEGDVLTYTVVTPPSHGTFDGTIYTPTANYFGADSFTFKANDGKVDSLPVTVSIVVTDVVEPNIPPVVSAGVYEYVSEEGITFTSVASDSDGTIVSYEWKDGDTVLSTEQSFTTNDLTPEEEHNIVLTVTDDEEAESSDNVFISAYTKKMILSKLKFSGSIWDKHIYTYDERGNMLTEKIDRSYNGSIDSIETFVYDELNRVISSEVIFPNEDRSMYKHSYIYDENGNMLSESHDEYWEGFPLMGNKATYTYDENSNMLTKNYLSYMPYGGMGDNFNQSYIYDEEGNTLTELAYAFGNLMRTIAYTHDSQGNILTKSEDTGTEPDGVVDSITTYTYDDQENLLSESYERFENGESFYVGIKQSNTYDEQGNMVMHQDDYGTFTYTYDDQGDLLTESKNGENILTQTWETLSGIEIIDDKSPIIKTIDPLVEGEEALGFVSADISSDDSMLIVETDFMGLATIEISDIDNPISSFAAVPPNSSHFTLSNDLSKAYFYGDGSGFRGIDISDLNDMEMFARDDMPIWMILRAIALSDDTQLAYVASLNNGLSIIDIRDDTYHQIVGMYHVDGAEDVKLSEDNSIAYVLNRSSLKVINVQDSSNPIEVGSLELPLLLGGGIVLSSDYQKAYISNWENGFKIIDISNAASPTIISSLEVAGIVKKSILSQDNTKAFVVNSIGLLIIDITDAQNPTIIGDIHTTGDAQDIVLSSDENRAYISDGTSGIQVLDISMYK